MTESYKALLQQRELLEQKIKEAREVELASRLLKYSPASEPVQRL